MIVSSSKDWVQQLYIREFGEKLLPTDFYYNDQGKLVYTESYHKRRGYCCKKEKCVNCSY